MKQWPEKHRFQDCMAQYTIEVIVIKDWNVEIKWGRLQLRGRKRMGRIKFIFSNNSNSSLVFSRELLL
jgi:hypothetical protein